MGVSAAGTCVHPTLTTKGSLHVYASHTSWGAEEELWVQGQALMEEHPGQATVNFLAMGLYRAQWLGQSISQKQLTLKGQPGSQALAKLTSHK